MWAVFDIRAVVPEGFRLVRHRFMPGAYEFTFRARKGHGSALPVGAGIGPCSENQTLQAFAADRLAVPHEKIDGGGMNATGSVEWIDRHLPAWATHRLITPFVPPLFHRGRAWHLPGHNKILAVQIEARSLPAGRFLDDLCGSFECLPRGVETPGPPA